MELYQLEQFKITAELEHVTRAAEMLSISQPALSRTIRNLEKEYNTTFFDHVGKNIVLNEKGKIFLKCANQILDSARTAKHEIRDQMNKEDSTVNLVVQAGAMLLPDIIRNFSAIYPHIDFKIVQYDSWRLHSQNADLVLTTSMRPEASDHCCVLLKEDILLALPSNHPLARHPSVHLREIVNEPLIGLQRGGVMATIMQYYCQQAGFEPNFIMENYTPTSLYDLIALGIGVAFIPSKTWKNIEGPAVKILPISGIECQRYITLSWNEGVYLSYAAKKFREYLIEYFAPLENDIT